MTTIVNWAGLDILGQAVVTFKPKIEIGTTTSFQPDFNFQHSRLFKIMLRRFLCKLSKSIYMNLGLSELSSGKKQKKEKKKEKMVRVIWLV